LILKVVSKDCLGLSDDLLCYVLLPLLGLSSLLCLTFLLRFFRLLGLSVVFLMLNKLNQFSFVEISRSMIIWVSHAGEMKSFLHLMNV
jgi:hypothetical protein